jgi:DNA-binding MarR family transcriptional regulator
MVKQSDLQLVSEIRTTITRLVKKLRKHTVTGMTLSLTERSVMGVLNEEKELLPNELAAREKITNQSMSQILNHLGELGYITRRSSNDDRRKSFISLTAKGTSAINQLRNEKDTWLHEAVINSCTGEEISILKKALIPLKKLVDFEDE